MDDIKRAEKRKDLINEICLLNQDTLVGSGMLEWEFKNILKSLTTKELISTLSTHKKLSNIRQK